MNFFEGIERAVEAADLRIFMRLKESHNDAGLLPKTFQIKREMRFINEENSRPKKIRNGGKK